MRDQWWSMLLTKLTKRYPQIIVATLILLGGTGLLAWKLHPASHQIVVSGLGETREFRTTEQTLAAALRTNGIELGSKDQVSPALTTSLKGQSEILVRVDKAIPVTVLVDGKTVEDQTTAKTVADLFRELSITLAPEDQTSVDVKAALTANMQIQVVRRSQQVTVTESEIPFDTVRREDRTLTEGETRDIQSGSPGVKETKQVTYYEDGKAVRTEVLEENVVKDPVDHVVAYGVGGVVSRGGSSYRYTRQMTMQATGYTAGKESNPDGNGYTYTGMRAVRGVVAVDPTVIPLYTRLYIEGYGPAIAGDIGGAIKGNRIDLCFDTLSGALDWGSQPVTVYVLGDQ